MKPSGNTLFMRLFASMVCVFMSMAVLCSSSFATESTASEMHIHSGMECSICGMYIEQYKKSAVRLIFTDDKEFYYCGCACALRDINEHGGLASVKQGYVTDWLHQVPVDIKTALLAVGSDVVPDMIPNIIAFEKKDGAEAFIGDHGGRLASLGKLLARISPVGMTIPFRVSPATTAPKNIFATAVGFKMMKKDDLITGTDVIDYSAAFANSPIRPEKVTMEVTFIKLVYGLSDDLSLAAVLPEIHKELFLRKKSGDVLKKTNSGIGDINLSMRWRLFHDDYSDRHFALYFGTSIPTGEFDASLPTALQLGKGAVSVTGGVLWSQRGKAFWFHSSLLGTFNIENEDDFQYGNTFKGGLALHFTPNPDNMIGLELDGAITARSQRTGLDVYDSGGTRANISLVTQNRILDVWGGSMNLKGMIGVPLYENVNGVQLGGAYHWMGALAWKRRF